MRVANLTILLLCCALTCTLSTGCTAIEKFQQAYQSAEADLKQLSGTLDTLIAKAEAIKADYDKAIAAGDTSKALALLDAGKAAFAEIGTARLAYEQGRTLVDNRRKELENAKSTQDYLTTIFGWVTAAVFGTGGLASLVVGRAKSGALQKTAANAKEYVPEANWQDFKDDQEKRLGTLERWVLDRARGA